MLLQNLSMSGSVIMVLISLPIAKPVIMSFSPSPSTSTNRILDSEPDKKKIDRDFRMFTEYAIIMVFLLPYPLISRCQKLI